MDRYVKEILDREERFLLADKLSCTDYRFGVEKLGPFLFGFTTWLYDSIKKLNINKVFFFARDGYMMKKCFEIFDNSIDSTYAYFSRNSIRRALLHFAPEFEESLRYLPWERFISYGKMLDYYCFSHAEKKELENKYNIDLNQDILFEKIKSNRILEKIYNDHNEIINKKSMEQNEALKQYLKQLDMLGKIAIVDIGWHGNMQYYVEEFFLRNNIDVDIEGFYVGIDLQKELQGNVHGYLYDPYDDKLRKSVLCFFGGYERLLQSCEGSTIGYQRLSNGIQPIITEYEYEEKEFCMMHIKEWQTGALDLMKRLADKDFQEINYRQFAYPLIKFGKKPSLADTELFRDFYNNDGEIVYYISQKPFYKYKIAELVSAISKSPWKTGFMKSLFRIAFPYFRIYCLMKK